MDKKLLKNLKNFSSDDYVNIESFLSFTKDTQELRDSLASLESLGYIKVVYSEVAGPLIPNPLPPNRLLLDSSDSLYLRPCHLLFLQ